jgi:hypothetical protein
MQQGVFKIWSRGFGVWLLAVLSFAMLDEDAAQLLHHAEKGIAALLDQYTAEQRAERADIAAQGKVFGGIGGAGS